MILNLDQAKKVKSEFDKYKGSAALELYLAAQNERMSLTEYMEKLDPTEKDMDGKPASHLDAFERHLMVSEIYLSGPNQFTVEQLVSTAQYLMPEMVLREIKAGMEVAEKFSYKDCIAATVPSKTSTYHPLYIPDQNLDSTRTRNQKSFGRTAGPGKGGAFPVVSIRKREKDIVINDNGRVIEAAYSVIRDYGWSDFAVYLRLIGAQLAADKLFDLYDLAVSGDGTVGAATDTFDGTAGTLSYQDLIHNQASFSAPFTMNRVLAPLNSFETVLSMAQFQDPLSGWEFQKSGKVVTPMGARMKQISATPGGTPTGTVIATLDSRYAAKEVISQALTVEADKIINRKFEEAVASEESRFCVIADGALKRIVWT
jgi:hypothetical protein